MSMFSDPILQRLQSEYRLEPLRPKASVYDGLLRSIVSQQLSTRAADTIWQRFLALSEGRVPDPKALLAMETEVLRSAGLSGQKASYLKNIASSFGSEARCIDWNEISDDEVISRLTAIKGVGQWTVEMLLIFTLAREDVFSVGDLALRQAIRDLYGLRSEGKALEKKCLTISGRWSPHRSLACRLLWKWRDGQKRL